MAPDICPAYADVSGIVVYADPHRVARLCEALKCMSGVALHASSSSGKIVATIETESEARSMERVAAIRALDGVHSVALVYHQLETDPDQEV